jgi:hypothetical protein
VLNAIKSEIYGFGGIRAAEYCFKQRFYDIQRLTQMVAKTIGGLIWQTKNF